MKIKATIFLLSCFALIILLGATGDKPNRVVVNKFISTAPATCTKGELQLKKRNLYVCYTTNSWTFANISSAP